MGSCDMRRCTEGVPIGPIQVTEIELIVFFKYRVDQPIELRSIYAVLPVPSVEGCWRQHWKVKNPSADGVSAAQSIRLESPTSAIDCASQLNEIHPKSKGQSVSHLAAELFVGLAHVKDASGPPSVRRLFWVNRAKIDVDTGNEELGGSA
jgi:hypothetical protein